MCENWNDRKSRHLHGNLTHWNMDSATFIELDFLQIINTTGKKSRVFKNYWDQANSHEGKKEVALNVSQWGCNLSEATGSLGVKLVIDTLLIDFCLYFCFYSFCFFSEEQIQSLRTCPPSTHVQAWFGVCTRTKTEMAFASQVRCMTTYALSTQAGFTFPKPRLDCSSTVTITWRGPR